MTAMHFEPSEIFAERANRIVEHEIRRISAILPDAEITHIGGTSIPGALTKGDVDLVVSINVDTFPHATTELRSIYAVNQPENWSDTFASFKDDESFSLPLGVQVVVRGSSNDFFEWFRQHLMANSDALAAYNDIKRNHEGHDPHQYRQQKEKFIEGLLARRAGGVADHGVGGAFAGGPM